MTSDSCMSQAEITTHHERPWNQTGITPKEMVLNIDFAPTILQLAGVDVPSSMQGKACTRFLAGIRHLIGVNRFTTATIMTLVTTILGRI